MWDTSERTRTRQPRKIRFSDSEWALIVERARLCGRAPARYVRETALGAVPRPGKAETTAPLIHELGRVGTTLAALAKREGEAGDAERTRLIDQALREVLDAVRRLA